MPRILSAAEAWAWSSSYSVLRRCMLDTMVRLGSVAARVASTHAECSSGSGGEAEWGRREMME
jgi:hypothetical protein